MLDGGGPSSQARAFVFLFFFLFCLEGCQAWRQGIRQEYTWALHKQPYWFRPIWKEPIKDLQMIIETTTKRTSVWLTNAHLTKIMYAIDMSFMRVLYLLALYFQAHVVTLFYPKSIRVKADWYSHLCVYATVVNGQVRRAVCKVCPMPPSVSFMCVC